MAFAGVKETQISQHSRPGQLHYVPGAFGLCMLHRVMEDGSVLDNPFPVIAQGRKSKAKSRCCL